MDIVVVVPPNANLNDMAGRLRRVSPPEPVYALLAAVRESVEKQGDNDDEIADWLNVCLTVTMSFVVKENEDDIRYLSRQLRGNFGVDYVACRLDAIQDFSMVDNFYGPEQ